VPATGQQERETWRILLFAGGGSELLVLKRPLGLCLPALHIPRYERIAASLNAEAARIWKLETVCVAPFVISHPDQTSGEARYHVMEVRRPEELSRIAPQIMSVASLEGDAFSDVRDYLAIRRAMKLDTGGSPRNAEGPFSKFGAFQDISTWVEAQLAPLGRNWNGAFRQWHASGSFALLRFQTPDGAVWFKAAGSPNQKELAITERLSTLFPRHLPAVISVRREWNAWLMNEVAGTSLDSGCDLDAWCCAATSFAELQVASIGHAPSILAYGAHDSRTAALVSQVAPFFAEIESLMEQQTKTTPLKLRVSEIRSLGARLTEALAQMERAAIPDTLNHFDLNPANVIVRSNGCKFLDWAEAAVGNPFLSFEYLRQHFLRTFGDEPDAATTFRQSFVKVWRELLPDSTIALGMEIIRLLAPFAYAVNALPWRAAHRDAQPECAGLLRSLARQMHREAEHMTRAA
jgi:Phosphotransferase enzyme family